MALQVNGIHPILKKAVEKANAKPKRKYVRKSAAPKKAGTKFDDGKPRLDLIEPAFENAMGAVLAHGVKVHGENSWKSVPEAHKRFLAALKRHTNAIARGEVIDKGTGESHASCVAINAMFLHYLTNKKKK